MVTTLPLPRRLLAEATGTMLLVATVVGSGVMATRLTKDVALALLGNTIPTGAILVVLILMLGPVSGAHFNPAVSLVMTLKGKLPGREALPYAAAQIAGGFAGTLLAHAMFELPLWQWSQTVRSGPGQWLAEVVATFGLVLAILGVSKHRPESVPLAVGLYVTAAYWFTASTSFANPAVTLARAASDTFAGIAPGDVGAFVVAQLAGAMAALWFGSMLFGDGGSGHPASGNASSTVKGLSRSA
ncbi:MIP/aquaporin family protein [Alsobacter sp. R-9]